VSGAQTITVTWGSSDSQVAIGLYEISGQAASSVANAAAALHSTSANPQFGASVTSAATHVIVTSIQQASGGAANITGIHSGNPFTADAINNSGTRGEAIASIGSPSVAGTYQPEWDYNVSDTGDSSTVAWKEASGGGSTFPAAILGPHCCTPIKGPYVPR
jgi:hypothetical protein